MRGTRTAPQKSFGGKPKTETDFTNDNDLQLCNDPLPKTETTSKSKIPLIFFCIKQETKTLPLRKQMMPGSLPRHKRLHEKPFSFKATSF